MSKKRCYGCMKIKSNSPICEHCGYDERTDNGVHRLPAGTILKEQYMIGKVLGQGGFGITYLGWDLYLDTPVAIKEYFPSGSVMRTASVSLTVASYAGNMGEKFANNKERFLREAKMLARFSEVPEIVHVKNFFLANNTAYIVMEYVEGINLKEYVKNQGGTISIEETFSIMKPIMEALCKVHKAGLVHRDISPDNIMMLPDGGAKLLDFGAIRDVGEAAADKELTQSTEAILKHGYAPMEQYQNRGSLGPWTDVYALCATMYYCMTGDVPAEAPERLLEDKEVDFRGMIPGLTAEQENTLKKGMELRAQDRIASVDELCEKLFEKKIITRTDTKTPVPAPVPRPDEQRDDKKKKDNKKPMLIAVLAVIAVVLIGVIASGISKKSQEVPVVESETEAVTEETAEEETVVEVTYDATGECGNDITWGLNLETKTLYLEGTGETWKFMLSDKQMEEEADKTIAFTTPPTWFEYAEDIENIMIGNGITHLNYQVFSELSNLKNVDFGNTVEVIHFAFVNSGLEEIVIPASVKKLGYAVFKGSHSLRKVTFEGDEVKLYRGIFAGCDKLEEVYLPKNADLAEDIIAADEYTHGVYGTGAVFYVYAGSDAHQEVLNLMKNYEIGYKFRDEFEGYCGNSIIWNFDKSTKTLYLNGVGKTWMYHVSDETKEKWVAGGLDADQMFSDGPEWMKYAEDIENVVVGDGINFLNNQVFSNLPNLKTVDFGNTVKSLYQTFANSGLEEIVIPENVNDIQVNVFRECENLRKVVFECSNAEIGPTVFGGCISLEEVYIPIHATLADDILGVSGEFYNQDVTFYVYEHTDAYDKIKGLADACGLNYEIIDEKLSGQCGEEITWKLDLETKTLYLEGKGQTWLYHVSDKSQWTSDYPEEWIFESLPEWSHSCEVIEHIVIGDGITHLNNSVFNGLTNLKDVEFGKDVVSLIRTFPNCGLEEITIPASVELMRHEVFRNNQNLKKVVFECENVTFETDVFGKCPSLEQVYFTKNAVIRNDLINTEEHGEDSYNKDLVFYVYENTDAHESAKWHEEAYGIKYKIIQ